MDESWDANVMPQPENKMLPAPVNKMLPAPDNKEEVVRDQDDDAARERDSPDPGSVMGTENGFPPQNLRSGRVSLTPKKPVSVPRKRGK